MILVAGHPRAPLPGATICVPVIEWKAMCKNSNSVQISKVVRHCRQIQPPSRRSQSVIISNPFNCHHPPCVDGTAAEFRALLQCVHKDSDPIFRWSRRRHRGGKSCGIGAAIECIVRIAFEKKMKTRMLKAIQLFRFLVYCVAYCFIIYNIKRYSYSDQDLETDVSNLVAKYQTIHLIYLDLQLFNS